MKMSFRVFVLSTAICFMSAGAVSTLAQGDSATLSGRITDPKGLPVPGVKVEAVNVLTNVSTSTETNEAGLYYIPTLLPAIYRVIVAKESFDLIVKPNVVVHAQDHAEINFELRIGSMATTVTVNSGGVNLNTTNATVATTVDQQFIQDMPTNGRSLQTVIQLAPGAVLNTTRGAGNDRGMFNINGQRSSSNSFTVDGVSGNVSGDYGIQGGEASSGAYPATAVNGITTSLASIDDLQEMTVVTSTGGIDLGHAAGGTVILTTKTGTNEFHGSLYDYLRNAAMDANNWFNNANGLARPPERQNDFGASLGGPVRIPHLYDGTDKTFFFLSYEGLRLSTPQTTTTAFAPLPSTIASAAAVYQPILKAIAPAPSNATNLENGFAQYAASFNNKNSVDAISLRIDHKLNSKVSLFGRYSHAPSSTFARDTANLALITEVQGVLQTLTIGSTQSISAQVVNEARFNFSQNNATKSVYGDNYGGAIPINIASLTTAMPNDSTYYSYFSIQSNFGGEYVQNGRLLATQRQVQVTDTIHVNHGSHHLSAGVDIIRIPVLTDPYQHYFYSAAAVANLNNGTVSTGSLSAYLSDAKETIWRSGAFAGDEWHATPRLVLNYGARWEIYPAPHFGATKPYQIQNVFDPVNATLAPVSSFWPTRYGNVGPRVGIAYRLPGLFGHETVLRAGTSEYFDPSALPTGNGANGFPFVATTSFASGTSVSQALATPTPPIGSLTTPYPSLTTFDQGLKTPQTWTWNATVQQSLGSESYFSVAYVGSSGIYLINPYTYNLRPFNPNFTTATVYTNASHSSYHALQLQYRRVAGPVQILASYTWAHSIDNASYSAYQFGALQPNRGDSDFDARNTFGLVMNYTTPRLKNGFVKNAIGQWTFEPHFQAQSALPINVIGGTVYLSDGSQQNYYAEYLGGPKTIRDPNAPGGIRLNPEAFAVPTTPAGANLGRNSVRMLGFWQLDASLSRAIVLSERFKLILRGDAFNLTNTPQFNGVYNFAIYPASLFGRYSATVASGGGSGALASIYQPGGPRSVQVSLRLQF